MMISYFFLCLMSMLCGIGILRILKISLSGRSIYLAPVMTFSFWAIFLGLGGLFHFPIKQLWLPGWILTIALSLLGLIQKNMSTLFKNLYQQIRTSNFHSLFLLTTAFILPILIMGPYFWYGLANYVGSNAPDGWSYIAFGNYIWENPRGTEGQLSPLHQYAAHLANTRFISSALLGFFSPLFGQLGDTQPTANLLLAWSLFNLASACAFFSISQKQIQCIAPLYLMLVIFSGTLLRVLEANNFDNAIILSLLPAYAGIVYHLSHQTFRWGIVLSLITAAAFYSYVELMPFLLLGAFILLIPYLWKSWQENKRHTLGFLLLILICTLILCLPYLKEGLQLLLIQFKSSLQSAQRPGEGMFSELLDKQKLIAAFWGLKTTLLGYGLGLLMTGLLSVGLVILIKKKEVALACLCLLLLLGSAEMIFHQRYSYGAYKLILLNWWLMTFAIAVAITKIMTCSQKYRMLFAAIFCAIGIGYFGTVYSSLRNQMSNVSIRDIRPLRALSYIKNHTNSKAILVNVDDEIANEWAVYFLREQPIKLAIYRLYMAQPHVLPFMKRAAYINPDEIQFELTDNPDTFPKKNLIWSSGPYYLWKIHIFKKAL